ncbi:SpoIIE family protein phosphatase [Frankia sp. BMG5.23]|uniref:SpoIIE family protein phosphatase n=1 Tax=Frankia sp. BMG5.23 TaxID=683305 RepID=UPI001F439903|nr:SpoIIE family protein phosphatase [Frankia sp. BMG5.23]
MVARPAASAVTAEPVTRDVIDGTEPRRAPEAPGMRRSDPAGLPGRVRSAFPLPGHAPGTDPAATFVMLDALFAWAPVGLALLDRAGRFLRVNDTLARFDRRPVHEHLGRTVSELLGDTGQELDALLARVLRTGEPVVDLEVMVATDGSGPPQTWLASWYPVNDPQVGLVGVAFVAIDASGTRAVEGERARADARYLGLVDAAAVDVFHAEGDGALDADLPRLRAFTGRHPAELAGFGWLGVVHPDDRERVGRAWHGAIEHGETFEAEFRISGGGGDRTAMRVVEARIVPMPAAGRPNSRPSEWLGVIRDLTEVRAAEADRATADQRARIATERAEQTATLAVALARTLTVDDVVATVLDVGGRMAGAAGRGVALVDEAHDRLLFHAPPGPADGLARWSEVALGAVHPVAEVMRGGRALFLVDRDELLARWPVPEVADVAAAAGEHAWAMLPLAVGGGAPFGVVTFGFRQAREFTAADQASLIAIADACAQALERATGYEQLAADAARGHRTLAATREAQAALALADRRLQLLGRATGIVAAAVEPPVALRSLAELIVSEVADLCVVQLVTGTPAPVPASWSAAAVSVRDGDAAGDKAGDKAGAEETAGDRAAEPVPELRPLVVLARDGLGTVPPFASGAGAATSPASPFARAARRGERLIVALTAGEWDPPADAERWIRQVGAHTMAVVPVVRVGHVVAVLSVTAVADRPPFTEADLLLLTELAARVGVVLDRIDRGAAERSNALALREALRGSPPAVPSGLEVATRYLPGGVDDDAGSDWFDVIDLGAGRVALMIGNVMGRGIRATAVMGQLRAAARTCARLDLPPAEVLTLLDGIVADLPGEEIATCIYAVVEIDSGVLTLASAGHPPPLVVAPDGLVSRLYMAVGSPLGVARSDVTEYTVRLGRGYLIALFTNGLVRGRARDLDAGVSQLAAALARASDRFTANLDDLVTTACAGLGPAVAPGPVGSGAADGAADEVAADDVALLFARLPVEPTAAAALLDVTFDGAASLRAVRAQARLALENAPLASEVVDTIVLVLSELASNAVRHGRPPLSVRLRLLGDRAVVEVADGGGRVLRRRHAAAEDEAGRGLGLVSQLAVRHGVRPVPDGKAVWAEIDLTGTTPPEPD